MSSPIAHRNASGIHPGAFVQNDPPSTMDVQNGVMWIDTHLDPPYQLKVWNADVDAWQLVGIVSVLPADCLSFPHGASICNDVVGTIHYNTSAGQHAMDASGYVLPAGHRLEQVG